VSLINKFKLWQFDKTRLETFSDGVFAIIITLLVLELKMPHDESIDNSAKLFDEIKHIFPVLFSWIVSVLIVGTLWLQHHNLLHMAKKSDYGMVWINTIVLMFSALIPFPAHLMGTYPHIPLAVASLGIVLIFVSLSTIWLYYYITKNYLKEEYNRVVVMKNVRLSVILAPLFYILAAAVAWIHPYITFAIYAIVPLLFLLPLDKPGAKKKL
jgi:uncharacterized membrane protein